MRKLKKPLIIVFILANLYAILCGGLYFFQNNLLFHPQPLAQDFNFNFQSDFKEVWIDIPDGAKLNGLHFTQANPKGVIVYYHGNAGSLAQWGQIAQHFVNKNYDVIIMDYRQYGKSDGILSEENLYKDSLEWYAFTKAAYPETPITIYGRSLGTTFATYVASQNEVRNLVLETPFYSIEDEAKSRFSWLPIKQLLKYSFPTYQYINDVSCPITIFHGTNDKVVNYEHGQKLFAFIKSTKKECVTVSEGGHNDLLNFTEYTDVIDRVLLKE